MNGIVYETVKKFQSYLVDLEVGFYDNDRSDASLSGQVWVFHNPSKNDYSGNYDAENWLEENHPEAAASVQLDCEQGGFHAYGEIDALMKVAEIITDAGRLCSCAQYQGAKWALE